MARSNWILIITMILSAAAGYYANVLANKNNNALLVQLLKDQLVCVNTNIESASSEGSRVDMAFLVARKNYLQAQLDYYSKRFGI